MPHAVEAAFREELRRAGLPSQGALPRLLALLRAAPETHLTLAEVADIAAETGLAVTLTDLSRQMESLADHGLIGRLPTITTDLVFDTVAEPHSHLVYEEAGQVIDLHVSADTLLAMVRKALTECPDGVEILVRYRREPGPQGGV
ncbi:MAG: Fur family transcriptional regulator [Caulobacter sp. 12-67-6]|nr:MAG: Fur family transcriptional regulator [Caulobacter sp. 12-67-6]OYX71866.1 MAG: Fur family transcriptional regulator [Caulobacter sp. 32-67-35]